MKKNGFTLIELLVVVILIAAIVLLALPKITNSVKNYNTNVDKTTLNIITSATKLYVSDNPNSFIKSSKKTYCISLNELIEEDYLKNTIQYNNQDITNTKVMKVTYDNGFNYELVNKDNCERVIKFDTVCEADSEQLYAENPLDIGYKYNCQVVPNKQPYTFYVLSYNDSNGNITSDKEQAQSINLIMDRNICSDGTFATKNNPCTVAWISEQDYGCTDEGCSTNEKGPITAMNYLKQATNKWLDTNTLKISSFNNNKNTILSMNTIYEINARLPYLFEIGQTGCSITSKFVAGTCPLWMVEYLKKIDSDSYATIIQKYETNTKISTVHGYWTLTSYEYDETDQTNPEYHTHPHYHEFYQHAWLVGYYGRALYVSLVQKNDIVATNNLYGVRPVITLCYEENCN